MEKKANLKRRKQISEKWALQRWITKFRNMNKEKCVKELKEKIPLEIDKKTKTSQK